MRNALARLLRQVSLALILVVATSLATRAQSPYPCPLSYGFFTNYDFISFRGDQYTFRFNIGNFRETLGPTVGFYAFPIMTSTNGNARLRNAMIVAHCTAGYFPLPPYAEPQLVLFVKDDGARGDLEELYTAGGTGDCPRDVSEREDPVPGGEESYCSGGGTTTDDPGTGSGVSGGGTICTLMVMEVSFDDGRSWTEVEHWWECG